MTEEEQIKFIRNKLKQVWDGMFYRCYEEKSKSYHRYGGRGIKVCKKWHTFLYFYADSVEPFINYVREFNEYPQIDRIDNDGNYEPDNCRWIDRDGNMLNSTESGHTPIDTRYKDLTYQFYNLSMDDVLKLLKLPDE